MSSTIPKLELTIQSSEGEEGIDQYFIDYNLTKAFEEYKGRFPKEWSERLPTNFDLCAFATGMGYVDLCSGAFALTHRRQAMTFMIELYTSPVFMVSKSKCNFFASEDWRSWKFWFWWVDVFSLGAWGFFVGVVFFFIVAMKGLDKCLDCLDNLDRQSGEEPEEQGEPEEPPEEPEKPHGEVLQVLLLFYTDSLMPFLVCLRPLSTSRKPATGGTRKNQAALVHPTCYVWVWASSFC